MSKDPFQILADELTLIRKDMDQLQRTSLNKDEAKKLNQIVTAAVLKWQRQPRMRRGKFRGLWKRTATRWPAAPHRGRFR